MKNEPGHSTGHHRPASGGFSLIELIVVIAIAALILSLSIGGYMMMGRGLSYNAAAQLIQGQLLAARNTAISQHSSSFVVIDGKNNTIQTFGQKNVGVWHFDDDAVGENVSITAGALSQTGPLKNGAGTTTTVTLAEGRYGAALSFPGPAAEDLEKLYVECGTPPAYVTKYNLREGVALSAWVYAEDKPGGAQLSDGEFLPIVAKVGDDTESLSPYALFLEYVLSEEKLKVGALISLSSGQVNEVLSDDAIVRPRSWTHVAMVYTNGGAGIRIFVNGILRKENSSVSGPLKLNQEPVHIGQTENTTRSGASSVTSAWFSGLIDEVLLGAYETGSPETIPEKVTVLVVNPSSEDPALGPHKVYFDARGYLDRQYHSDIPEVVVLSPLEEWNPAAHSLYGSEGNLTTFQNNYLRTEDQRRLLDDSNRVKRLKLTWAGTVE